MEWRLLLFLFGLGNAKLPSFTQCDSIHCDYCSTPRMQADCSHYCDRACKQGKKPEREPAMKRSHLSANDKFGKCCDSAEAAGRISDPDCRDFCTFEALDKDRLVEAYLTQSCGDKAQIKAILDCGSQDHDAQKCCAEGGYTGVYAACVRICDPSTPLELDLSLMHCLDKLSVMRACFKTHMESLPDSRFLRT